LKKYLAFIKITSNWKIARRVEVGEQVRKSVGKEDRKIKNDGCFFVRRPLLVETPLGFDADDEKY
jgi:hypothetical protein